MEQLAELARRINEQTLRTQEAQAEVDRMLAVRQKAAEEVERAWQEHQAREREQA